MQRFDKEGGTGSNIRPHTAPPGRPNVIHHTDGYGQYHPSKEQSILHHHDQISNPTNKGHIEFDPSTAQRNYEDTTRKGHSKQDKVEKEINLSGDHGKRVFCKNLIKSMSPLSTFLTIAGRFPLSYSLNKDEITYDFTSSCHSFKLLHFNFTTLLIVYALIALSYSSLLVCVDIPLFERLKPKNSKELIQYEAQRMFDKALIQRNAVPLIIIFTALIQAFISSLLFIKRHTYLAHIFGFLNTAACTMHMDLGEHTKNFSVQSTVMFASVTCIFILFSSLKFGPSTIGTPSMFGSLLLRPFLGFGRNKLWLNLYDEQNTKVLLYVHLTGGIFLVITFIAAKAPILLFIYKCKIVRNAFAFWNGRAYCALLRGREFAQTEEARTTYKLLFNDHCVLLDLLDSINQMYAYVIESFFCLEATGLFFQMYFFFRTGSETKLEDIITELGKHATIHYVRPYDWLPALLILFTTSTLLLVAGKAAAKVSEEAQAGIEVIRRKGVIDRKTDQELEFLYSMRFSFESEKKLEIFGAGYLHYNKGFISLFVLACLFCFLLLCQFSPLLDVNPGLDTNQIIGRFLKRLEETSDHNSSWADPMDNNLWSLGV